MFPTPPSAPELTAVLTYALLRNGPLSKDLYRQELEPNVLRWMKELHHDEEDFVFVVIVDRNQVAMVLVHIDGLVSTNSNARVFLQTIWPLDYETRIVELIPKFVDELSKDCYAMIGVKIIKSEE